MKKRGKEALSGWRGLTSKDVGEPIATNYLY